MSRKSAPCMKHHRGSAAGDGIGQARVRVKGKDIYLGKWGSPEAAANYAAFVAEWSANGGHLAAAGTRLSVSDLCFAFDDFCEQEVGREQMSGRHWKGAVKAALSRLHRQYGHLPAASFGPKELASIRSVAQRESWVTDVAAAQAVGIELAELRLAIDAGGVFKSVRRIPGPGGVTWFFVALADLQEFAACTGRTVAADVEVRKLSPRYINTKVVGLIRHVFRWASQPGRGLVPARVAAELRELEPLAAGRIKRKPVADDVVQATLGHLPAVVADMVQVQRLTGMRPAEVCRMTWAEIEQAGEFWMYSPTKHKTERYGQERHVLLSVEAQALLMKYKARGPDESIFSPAESVAKVWLARSASRRSKRTPSQTARDAKCAANPKSKAGTQYTTGAYARAISRACRRAGVAEWSPNQLRHARAKEVYEKHGIDVARAILGHAKTSTTHEYLHSSSDMELQRRAMAG